MKVIVIGAGGRLGSRILTACVREKLEVVAFVRSGEKLRAAVPAEVLQHVRIVEGDAQDRSALVEAMQGCEAGVQTAGYIGDSYEEAQELCKTLRVTTEAACEALTGARRWWALGGAACLDIPGRGLKVVDLKGLPAGMHRYLAHRDNYEYLRESAGSLDWSLACPGSMFDAPEGNASPPEAALTTADELPFELPGWANLLPAALLILSFPAVKRHFVGPSYEAVAAAIVENLAPGGPLRHKRVGFAAPR